jgi:hypothetical protein
MDKRPQLLAKNKTDLMSNNASCKRWDTPGFSVGTDHSFILSSTLPELY